MRYEVNTVMLYLKNSGATVQMGLIAWATSGGKAVKLVGCGNLGSQRSSLLSVASHI